MVQQVEQAVGGYTLMIHGVLKAGHVYRQSPQYEDYFQELQLLIIERQAQGEVLAPHDNPLLFRWLLWRLRELQRRSKRVVDRQVTMTPLHEFGQLAPAIKRFEQREWLQQLVGDANLPSVAQQLLQHLLQYPDVSVPERCALLQISRATYWRRWQQLREYALQVEQAV